MEFFPKNVAGTVFGQYCVLLMLPKQLLTSSVVTLGEVYNAL